MRFVVLSDTHGRHRSLKLPKGDIIIHAGDISYQGEQTEVEDFLAWFQSLPFQQKIFIAGNHDFFLEKKRGHGIENIIPDTVTYLKESSIEIKGVRIWGSPYTPWFHNWAFNKKRGAPLKKIWDTLPEKTDIVITHGPAYGILDQLINEQHVGCKDLLHRLLEVKPRVHIHGHIHEAFGAALVNGIKTYNCSILNEYYEMIHQPFVFDL